MDYYGFPKTVVDDAGTQIHLHQPPHPNGVHEAIIWDVRYQIELLSLVKRMNVHNDLNYCDTTVALEEGKTVDCGPTETVMTESLIAEVKLPQEFIYLGFKARLAAIDLKKGLDTSFAGRIFNKALLEKLPPDTDPCAERGEFHTFAFDGPIFSRPVSHSVGALEHREHSTYIDFLHDTEEAF